MSMHYQRMLQRYGLGSIANMHSQVLCDPISALLTAAFTQIGVTGSIFGISAASIAGALSTGGGWMELKI